MSKYTTELAAVPPLTLPASVGGGVITQTGGLGYPTGDALHNTYYPNSPPAAATNNPHGVPNSPDQYPATGTPPGTPRYAYSQQTWEQKAAAMVPPGVFATPVTVAANQPYPTTP